MKKLSYQEQIKRPEWQKKRLEILQIHNFKCDICNSKTTELHVHHRFYINNRKIWEYDNDVLQVLCKFCHNNLHEKDKNKIILNKKEIDLLNLIKDNNYSIDSIICIIKKDINLDDIFTNKQIYTAISDLIGYCCKNKKEDLYFALDVLDVYANLKNGKITFFVDKECYDIINYNKLFIINFLREKLNSSFIELYIELKDI